MNADDRLNQLEPLISENMAILDRHTAQLKQLSVASSQIIAAIAHQGDTITFLLHEQIAIKGDIVEMKGDIVEMKGDITGIKGDITGIKDKLDQVLSLLQKSGR